MEDVKWPEKAYQEFEKFSGGLRKHSCKFSVFVHQFFKYIKNRTYFNGPFLSDKISINKYLMQFQTRINHYLNDCDKLYRYNFEMSLYKIIALTDRQKRVF